MNDENKINNENNEDIENKERTFSDALKNVISASLDKVKEFQNDSSNRETIPNGIKDEKAHQEADVIREISKLLKEQDFHPVLIFGTRASGKTTLLTSLLNYFRQEINSNGTLTLSKDPLLPLDTAQGKEVDEEARNFFNKVVGDFGRGEPAPQTRFPIPFFIPLILEPKNNSPKIKIALLESQGGFYQVDKNRRSYNPEIKEEIKDIYENFDRPISIIIIAPYNPFDSSAITENILNIEEEYANIDSGLLSIISHYHTFRNEKYRKFDKINFLLTKWDMFFIEKYGHLKPNFYEFNPALIKKIIEEKYRSAWTQFVNLPRLSKGHKGVMPYSVGIIEEARNTSAGKNKSRLNEFPRRLWDWIYFNSTGGKSLYGYRESKKSFLKRIIDIFF